MKIIKKQEVITDGYMNTYEFDQSLTSSHYPTGLIILYTIMHSPKINVVNLEIDFMHDMGEMPMEEEYDCEMFEEKYPDLKSLSESLNKDSLVPWLVELEGDILISGRLNSTVRISYTDPKYNPNRIALNLEQETYDHHEFSPSLVKRLMEDGSSKKVIVNCLAKVKEYPDIYQEFYLKYTHKAIATPIVEAGYDADCLINEHHFSILGAYVTLSELREDPTNTIANLNKKIK